MTAPSLIWFRQDLRLADQPALAAAAAEGPVIPVYVLDDDRPGRWAIGGAQRWWLHHSLDSLATDLKKAGAPLVLRRGDSAAELLKLAEEAGAGQIHAIRHYEPWWQDAQTALGDRLVLHDGNYLDDPRTVRTRTDGRYRIFTPFWKALRDRLPPEDPRPAPMLTGVKRLAGETLKTWELLPTKPDWAGGFADWQPGEAGAAKRLHDFLGHVDDYDTARNLPSQAGSSSLSPHFHFGEISPRAVWHAMPASRKAEPFLREIGWRDFTANLEDQFPKVGEENGRPAFDRFPWRKGAAADRDFQAWTRGRTGYPIVDAGMRQLWTTGWMHNRVRMITASFLIKHVLIEWRRGAEWFWDTLVDADYGNNSVNWQWVAGSGVDSNPFGRIMAPLTQSAKFDAGDYIRHWVPELGDLSDEVIHDPHGEGAAPKNYPEPLIGHKEARERALAAAAKIRG